MRSRDRAKIFDSRLSIFDFRFPSGPQVLGLGELPEEEVAEDPSYDCHRHTPPYARDFVNRIQSGSTGSLADAVQRGYRLALGRRPDETERNAALKFIETQTASYAKNNEKECRTLAMADFCQVLFGLNEFIYVD